MAQNDVLLTKPKRKKVTVACKNCRLKKIKCSGSVRCEKCIKLNIPCVYINERKYIINSTESIGSRNISEKTCFLFKNKIEKELRSKVSEDKIRPNKKTSFHKSSQFPIMSKILTMNQCPNELKSFALEIDNSNDGDLIYDRRLPAFNNSNNGGNSFQSSIHSPSHTVQNTKQSTSDFSSLGLSEFPSKHLAFEYLKTTWNIACISFRFYHRPTIYNLLESIYDLKENEIPINDLQNFSFEQKRALPLFYLIFACGILFINEQKAKESNNILEFFNQKNQYENVGLDFFESAKKLIDFINGSDARTVQSLFMMSLYCQFTARLPEAYTYNSMAITTMLKRGCYKKNGNSMQNKGPLQAEIIKRMFWSCYKIEIYMSTILGHPIKLKLKDVTQDFPIDTADENISNTHITLNSDNEIISSCGINNVHTKLMLIMYEIKEHYQDLASEQLRSDKADSFQILPSLEFVKRIERSLIEWVDMLPDFLKPSTKSNYIPDEFLRINKLLHLDYLSIKLMLYKPFTQIDFNTVETPFQAICVNICVEVINLTEMMWNKHILAGSYWFSQYTIFFALAILTSWKLKCGDNFDDVLELNRSHGLELLDKLKECSVTSMYIYKELTSLFKLENSGLKKTVQAAEEDSKQFKHSFKDIESSNVSLTPFENNQDSVLFEKIPFFESKDNFSFKPDQFVVNSIFEQFNDLFS
ncbi:hypothetical protein QEN19_002874 [Hanseniaspora menglaensis]